MPHRFLLAENMDEAKAWARWEATLQWRKENNTDDILSKPHPRFVVVAVRVFVVVVVRVFVIVVRVCCYWLLFSSSTGHLLLAPRQ